MTSVIELSGLTKRYRDTLALDAVDLSLTENVIHGLLGRNGAGKTTLMSIVTAQNFASRGSVRVFGEDPYENPRVLSRMCFVRESQRYPDDATVTHALAMARLFFPRWNSDLAETLLREFDLPRKQRIKKLSRGQFSAVGVIIGLASRAEVTFFDEPYLGLDAVARQLFYDHLLADYAEHPRTIVLSSHLIDEISALIEHVVVIEGGKILLDEATEELRSRAATVVGEAGAVAAFVAGREVLHRETLGRTAAVTVLGALDAKDRADLAAAGLDLSPVSLQQLVVRLTQNTARAAATDLEGAR